MGAKGGFSAKQKAAYSLTINTFSLTIQIQKVEYREVDQNHIILLGGAQWNGYFEPFSDWKFDNKIMYTCHRYGGEPTKAAIQSIIDFRDKTKLPMYMGEIGHISSGIL